MKLNYKSLRSNIPSKLRTKSNVSFDVLWQDDPKDKSGNRLFGITYFEPNQIVLATNQSDKEVILTAWHEYLHALADTYDIKLTESEVRRLEKAFPYIREFVLALEGIKK